MVLKNLSTQWCLSVLENTHARHAGHLAPEDQTTIDFDTPPMLDMDIDHCPFAP